MRDKSLVDVLARHRGGCGAIISQC